VTRGYEPLTNSRDPSVAIRIKSGHSGVNGGDRIGTAPGFPDVVPVRDSKNPDGPVLVVSRSARAAFTVR
jgi:hypothetical protein